MSGLTWLDSMGIVEGHKKERPAEAGRSLRAYALVMTSTQTRVSYNRKIITI